MKASQNISMPTPRRGSRLFRSFLICLVLFAAAALRIPAAGAETKEVRVGWYDSAFNQKDEFGRRFGYAYEYQMKIAAYTGWHYKYVEGSWAELFQMLLNGEIDLLSDVSYTEERARHLLYPGLPMGTEEYFLFTSQGNHEISLMDYSTLNGKKVGVNKDSFQEQCFLEWAMHHGVRSELIEVTCSEEEALRLLDNGSLDAYVTVYSFAQNEAAQANPPSPVCRIGSSDFYFALSKDRTDLLLDLDHAMLRIKEEDRYFNQKLSDKYLVPAGPSALLTADEREWLDAHQKIRVGYQDNYLPFCAADPASGELTGALKDYLDEAADCFRNAHLDFETFPYPTVSAAVEAMHRGEIDCVFPANLSAGDGENMGLFLTTPLMRTDVFAVVPQEDMQVFEGREHVIAAVDEGNPNYESCLRRFFPSWHMVVFPTTQECLKAVDQGVADCLLISNYRYSSFDRLCGRLGLVSVDTGVEVDYSFAVASGNPQLFSILSRADDLVPAPSINTALTHYVAEGAKPTLKDFLEDHATIVTTAGAVILLIIVILLILSLKAQRKAARLISATETDALTGLYNRDFFLQYAALTRREHPGVPMDAVVINIDRFHAVNALNGREFGDQVLRSLGSEVRAIAEESHGIAGRFEADHFDIFCRPQKDYVTVCERLQNRINELSPSVSINVRMGVMPWHKNLDVIQLFDKAHTACSMAKENFSSHRHLVIFDEKLQEREDYEQRLLNDLQRALQNYEFEVYMQPQYDIQCEPPRLVGAEALVRWNHPTLGLIPPNDFIPLMERHGKIGEIDHFVWSETARLISRWRELCGITLPVSVNLSRMDVFDPNLESALDRLLAYHSLSPACLRLEVTESAYTGSAEQVITVVERLRGKGYIVEMDDFGSGYSSLNMLSSMPVDVLKMDKAFIQHLGQLDTDTSLVALILGIAQDLQVPVVAEGVETPEQLELLRKLGCPLVQGYYFCRPLPAQEFENKMIRPMQQPEE